MIQAETWHRMNDMSKGMGILDNFVCIIHVLVNKLTRLWTGLYKGHHHYALNISS